MWSDLKQVLVKNVALFSSVVTSHTGLTSADLSLFLSSVSSHSLYLAESVSSWPLISVSHPILLSQVSALLPAGFIAAAQTTSHHKRSDGSYLVDHSSAVIHFNTLHLLPLPLSIRPVSPALGGRQEGEEGGQERERVQSRASGREGEAAKQCACEVGAHRADRHQSGAVADERL